MKAWPVLLSSVVLGCAVPRVTAHAPRTQTRFDGTARAIPRLPSKAVVLVSPTTFSELSADLAFAEPRRSVDSQELQDLSGVAGMVGATRLVERVLFDAGWNALSQPDFARIVTGHRAAVSLRELAGRRGTLLEAGAVVALASTMEGLVVLHDFRLGWSKTPSVTAPRALLCPLAGQIEVGLYDRAGHTLWRAHVDALATDLFDMTLSGNPGWSPDRTEVATRQDWVLSHPDYACVATSDCSACAAARPELSPAARDAMTVHLVKAALAPLTKRP